MLGRDLAGPCRGRAQGRGGAGAGALPRLLGADRPALDERLRNLYESFGAREDKHGRTLEILLAAYRQGARGAWEHFPRRPRCRRADPGRRPARRGDLRLYRGALPRQRGRLHPGALRPGRPAYLVRQQLGEVLLFEGPRPPPPASPSSPRRPAGRSPSAWRRWSCPRSPAPKVGAPAAPTRSSLPSRTPRAWPSSPPTPCAGPARPSPRRRAPATSVYVGTVRAWPRRPSRWPMPGRCSASSWRASSRARRWSRPRTILTDLVLHADPRLLADLTADALAPLQGLSPGRREILAATLRVWLAAQGTGSPPPRSSRSTRRP